MSVVLSMATALPKARATVKETFLTNAVFAEVPESQKARATVTETLKTNVAYVAD
jgi:hypothetical protein